MVGVGRIELPIAQLSVECIKRICATLLLLRGATAMILTYIWSRQRDLHP